jgi:hypothetical protein
VQRAPFDDRCTFICGRGRGAGYEQQSGKIARKFLRQVSDFRFTAVGARHQPARIALRFKPKRSSRAIGFLKKGYLSEAAMSAHIRPRRLIRSRGWSIDLRQTLRESVMES